jgi:hypothetical protein
LVAAKSSRDPPRIVSVSVTILRKDKLRSSSGPENRCLWSMLRVLVDSFARKWVLLAVTQARAVASSLCFALPLVSAF